MVIQYICCKGYIYISYVYVGVVPLLWGDTETLCLFPSPDLHQRGGLLVILQYAAGCLTGQEDYHITCSSSHSLKPCLVFSCPFTHISFFPTKSSFSFFTLVSFIHTPSLHAPPFPAGISHGKAGRRGKDPLLCQNCYSSSTKDPFILSYSTEKVRTAWRYLPTHSSHRLCPTVLFWDHFLYRQAVVKIFSSSGVHFILTSENDLMLPSDLLWEAPQKPETDKARIPRTKAKKNKNCKSL